jgi:hypothetical protein
MILYSTMQSLPAPSFVGVGQAHRLILSLWASITITPYSLGIASLPIRLAKM